MNRPVERRPIADDPRKRAVTTSSDSPEKKANDKKAKVAAAIAKAKAKKLEKAKMNEQDNTQANTQNESND